MTKDPMPEHGERPPQQVEETREPLGDQEREQVNEILDTIDSKIATARQTINTGIDRNDELDLAEMFNGVRAELGRLGVWLDQRDRRRRLFKE
jgi:hypothetical protein